MNLKDNKVLVTGADGFIGSHLVEYLLEMGYHVKAIACYNSFNSMGWLDHLTNDNTESLEIVVGDVRDANQLNSFVRGCDIVYHLAALGSVPYSYSAVSSFVETNVHGTLNVLEAVKNNDVAQAIVVSSSEVYGNAQTETIDENHRKIPQSPYAASKLAADALVTAYVHSYNLPVVIARPFNTFGPRQSLKAVIPQLIHQLWCGKNEIELGTLTTIRDFTYVKDTVRALYLIGSTMIDSGTEINICTSIAYKISDIATKLIEKINPDAVLRYDQSRIRPVKSEVNRLCGNYDKLHDLTGWQPAYSFDRGLDELILWVKENQVMINESKGGYHV